MWYITKIQGNFYMCPYLIPTLSWSACAVIPTLQVIQQAQRDSVSWLEWMGWYMMAPNPDPRSLTSYQSPLWLALLPSAVDIYVLDYPLYWLLIKYLQVLYQFVIHVKSIPNATYSSLQNEIKWYFFLYLKKEKLTAHH